MKFERTRIPAEGVGILVELTRFLVNRDSQVLIDQNPVGRGRDSGKLDILRFVHISANTWLVQPNFLLADAFDSVDRHSPSKDKAQ